MVLLERAVSEAMVAGVAGCRAEDVRSNGRHVRIRGRDLLNFGSCSYLGLELDPRLIEGSIHALRAHGIETSSSRGYLSSPLYAELELLLQKLFDAHVVVTPTTTLGHLAALPMLVDPEDAVILDHQVHSSVQMACRILKSDGVHVEIVRHNHLARLEGRIAKLSARHRQVWYMADGVYSMFGDLTPAVEIVDLLDRYPQMRFYVDDAHGMSWCGPRGSGSVLATVDLHPRMVLSTGLAKGFGTGGGVIVLPDEVQRDRVQSCGPTMIFSGPLQPPILGAAIESARIHLSREIETLQAELRERLALCDAAFREVSVPLVSSPQTPVGFVGTGPTAAGRNLCLRLMDEGFFTNPAQFPATPMRRSGGRFLITRHHELVDVEALVAAIGRHWEPAVRAAGAIPKDVWDAFDLEPPIAPCKREGTRVAPDSLTLETANSIEKLDHTEWNRLMGDRGCLGTQALSLFEQVFGPEAEPENRWSFRYYVLRDGAGEPVLATCFTAAMWKADMLAPAEVSEAAELRRREDPLYLTQRVFAAGCLLSEGAHLWMREPADSDLGHAALALVLEAVRRDARSLGCEVRVIRDIPDSSPELIEALEADGMLRMPAPDSLVLEDVGESESALVARLSRKHRRHQYGRVRPFDDRYDIEVIAEGGRALSADEVLQLHRLYTNVKSQSLDINTFGLPEDLLPALVGAPGWELLVFRPCDRVHGAPVAFLASYIRDDAYAPLFVDLDYDYVGEHGLYRQVLRHANSRARSLGRKRVLFGFGASLEKRRFGARPETAWMCLETDDHYTFDALAQLASQTA
ncbi:MAG: hypothetical protein CL908_09255 [Deltaproteobacteria bacterium]|nr:hypothetical protein [Deltaproteobacteria bacterium]